LLYRAVNIPCRVVKGKVKGSGYRLGDVVEGTNDYCMVYVDQSWRFVDPHWGSQFVISSVDNNGDWEMIRPDSPSAADANKNDIQQEQIGYNCDDFYFLTDPVAMVYTHLTCDPNLQVCLLLSNVPSLSHVFTARRSQSCVRPSVRHLLSNRIRYQTKSKTISRRVGLQTLVWTSHHISQLVSRCSWIKSFVRALSTISNKIRLFYFPQLKSFCSRRSERRPGFWLQALVISAHRIIDV